MATIHQAAYIGDLRTVQTYIQNRGDINVFHEGKTPLFFAASYGQLEVCRLLLEHGATMNPSSVSGNTPLFMAVGSGNINIVRLLLPRCHAKAEFRALDAAVSSGFHEIADLMLNSGIFRYPHEVHNLASHNLASPETFRQWQRFLSSKHDRIVNLDQLHLEYALVIASMAGEEGLQLIEELLKDGIVDINCRVKIGDSISTPLTAAAERGKLGVIRFLLHQPRIDVTISGNYKWPAFLHLLRSPLAISCQEGLTILNALGSGLNAGNVKLLRSPTPGPFETVFENAIRSSNETIIRLVIDIVRGVNGTRIIPLLVRGREKQGVRWLLSQKFRSNNYDTSWVPICEYLKTNEDPEVLELFVEVAECFVQWQGWSQAILMCLSSLNFGFAKQFFYSIYHESLPNLAEETLQGYNDAAANQALIQEWESRGLANVALWRAALTGMWRFWPGFEKVLSDTRINPNRHYSYGVEPVRIAHGFFQHTSESLPPGSTTWDSGMNTRIFQNNPNNRGADSQETTQPDIVTANSLPEQIILPVEEPPTVKRGGLPQFYVEQLQRRRRFEAKHPPIPCILIWAAQAGHLDLVSAMLRSPHIDVNIQDPAGNTCLIFASARGDKTMAAALLARSDIRVNITDKQGRSALFYAAQSGYGDIIEIILQTNKASVSIRDTTNRRALEYAEEGGHNGISQMIRSYMTIPMVVG